MSAHRLQPQARRRDLLVRDLVDGEVVVYDLESHEAHSLNPSVAAVWRLCDGQRGAADIAAAASTELGQPMTRELVELALAQLSEATLLEELPDAVVMELAVSRREALGHIGKGALVAALVPVITTILAPTPAAAGTCTPNGGGCSSGFQCCSGFCNPVTHTCEG